MTWRPHGPAVLLRGSCLDVLPRLAAAGFRAHASVSDPPYGIEFLGHAWDAARGCVAHDPATWRLLAACLRPGAHALAMSHDSTYHRLGHAMEQAGLHPRHMIPWLYATGRCQAQRVAGGDPEHAGLAPRLAPACEPAYLGRLALEAGCSVADNLRRHGTGALRVEAVRSFKSEGDLAANRRGVAGFERLEHRVGMGFSGGMRETRAPPADTRYPKALVHDDSPEVRAVFDRQGSRYSCARKEGSVDNANPSYGKTYGGGPRKKLEASSGSGARYFPSVDTDEDSFAYVPKPKGAARDESDGHPTPKPLALMRWFVRMVTCFEGQVVIDPFLGSGTTMRAALDEGMGCVGIELDEVTAGGLTACLGYCATVARRCPEVRDHVAARALADLGLRLSFEIGGEDLWTLVPADAAGDPEDCRGQLRVMREHAGEATARDPLGRAMGLTLDEHRVQLRRAWLEADLAPGAPADLGDRLAELAGWPEAQALLCRRGDLVEPG